MKRGFEVSTMLIDGYDSDVLEQAWRARRRIDRKCSEMSLARAQAEAVDLITRRREIVPTSLVDERTGQQKKIC